MQLSHRKPGNDSRDELFSCMFELGRVLQKRITCRTSVPLTTLHLASLFHIIETADAADMRSLAGFLRMSAPSVSRLVSSLERSGLITRSIDAADRRRIGLALTKKGIRIVEEVDEEHRTEFAKIVSPLSEKERSQLIAILEKIIRNA